MAGAASASCFALVMISPLVAWLACRARSRSCSSTTAEETGMVCGVYVNVFVDRVEKAPVR